MTEPFNPVQTLVCRALVPMGGVAYIGKHLRTLRQKWPSSVALMLLSGHYLMSQVRPRCL